MTKEEFGEYLDNENNIVPMICYIPNNTCRLVINVIAMDDDGEVHEASQVMSLPEIIDARIDGEEWESENIKYCLTEATQKEIEEKGVEQVAKEILEQLKRSGKND